MTSQWGPRLGTNYSEKRSTLRAAPSKKGKFVLWCEAGDRVEVLAVDEGFAKLRVRGETGFVPLDEFMPRFSGPHPVATFGVDEPKASARPTNIAPYSMFMLLVPVTVAGAILGMVAMFAMPVARCGPLSMNATDFGDDYKRAAFNLCGELGGSQEPASGLWVTLAGGAMFFGAGGALVVSRGNKGGVSRPSPMTATTESSSTRRSRNVVRITDMGADRDRVLRTLRDHVGGRDFAKLTEDLPANIYESPLGEQARAVVRLLTENGATADLAEEAEGAMPASPSADVFGGASAQSATSLADELERLVALHERGALTDEEFENAKRHVIDG